MPLLSAFHIHYDHWCPYASMIVVEMYTADTATGYAVRFVYNGESITVRAASLRLSCVVESLIIIFWAFHSWMGVAPNCATMPISAG